MRLALVLLLHSTYMKTGTTRDQKNKLEKRGKGWGMGKKNTNNLH